MEQCPAERIIESMMKACALNNEDNGCSSTIHSVRSMLLFRLCGGVHVLLKQLTKHYHELLVSLPMSDPPKLTESIILQTLQLLHDFSSNYDFSYEFASIGGHTLLKKLLLIDSPTIVELTEDIIGTITSTGCVFPTTTMRIMSDDDVREGLMLMPTIHKFRDDESIFHVFLRKAPQRMYGSTHERVVGYVLWNSAVILSRWLVTNEKILVRNKSVLEIGAGLGLCGLVAARYASSMSLSDWTNELLVNLDVNLGLNSGSELINGECGSVLPTCACDVRHLDWSKLPHIQQHDQDNNGDDMSTLLTLGENNGLEGIEQKGIIEEDTVNEGISWSDEVQEKPTFLPLEKSRLYDVIIGSDIVYCREDAVNVPNVLWHHLAPLGTVRHTVEPSYYLVLFLFRLFR